MVDVVDVGGAVVVAVVDVDGAFSNAIVDVSAAEGSVSAVVHAASRHRDTTKEGRWIADMTAPMNQAEQ